MLNRIKRFFSEARQELRHVNWPTREEAARLTAIVIGISIGLALFLGLFDFLFSRAVRNIVLNSAPPATTYEEPTSTPPVTEINKAAVPQEENNRQ